MNNNKITPVQRALRQLAINELANKTGKHPASLHYLFNKSKRGQATLKRDPSILKLWNESLLAAQAKAVAMIQEYTTTNGLEQTT